MSSRCKTDVWCSRCCMQGALTAAVGCSIACLCNSSVCAHSSSTQLCRADQCSQASRVLPAQLLQHLHVSDCGAEQHSVLKRGMKVSQCLALTFGRRRGCCLGRRQMEPADELSEPWAERTSHQSTLEGCCCHHPDEGQACNLTCCSQLPGFAASVRSSSRDMHDTARCGCGTGAG